MMPDWPVLTLRDANIVLIDCDHRTPPATANGFPYVTIPQLKDGHIDFSDARRISAEHFKEWTRRACPQHNDVVLSRRCNPGVTAYVSTNANFAVGQNLVLLRADGSKVFPPFLRWVVRGPEWWDQVERFLNHGAVFESLKCGDIPQFALSIPPVDEQIAIAHLLGALDDKIELNRRMSRTLEEMASALFRSWFVDFDPVIAKAAGRKPFGMPSNIARFFPSTFCNSDGDPTPAGWKRVCIKEIYSALFDGPHATPPEAEKGPVYLGIKNLTGTQLDLGEIRHISEADYPRWTKRVAPRHLDIVFTYEATIGFCALVPAGLRCCLGRRLALVRAIPGYEHFLFHTMTAQPFQELLGSHIWSGSTVDRTPLTEFPNYPILWPGDQLAKAFDSLVLPWWRMIHHNQTESRTLGALRERLLPKLLSGELRVRDAEKQVAAAV